MSEMGQDAASGSATQRPGACRPAAPRSRGLHREMFRRVVRELLRQGRSVRFRAKGNSMYPTIRDGEAIVVEPITPSSVRPGDIVLYQTSHGLFAHRVVSIGDGLAFRLRGDASGSHDEPVRPEQVLGKVSSVEKQRRCVDLTSATIALRAWVHRVVRASKASIRRFGLNS